MCRQQRQRFVLRVTIWLATLYTCVSQSAKPSSLGCSYHPDRHTVACSNTTLENIVHSVRILNAAANATMDARSVEVVDSVLTHLPYLLPPFNTSLESVKLVNSQLEFVYPDAFTRLGETLKFLNLSENRLHSVPYAISALKNLEVLDLSDNQIVFLRPSPVFDGLSKLRVLVIDRNYLGFSSDYVIDVKHLNASGNHSNHLAPTVEREDFDLGVAVKTLVNLSLRGNRFSSVPEELHMSSLPSLRLLDLSDNLIQALPKLNVNLLPVLQVLILRNNRINRVAFFSLPTKLIHLDLSGNPFHCDCESLWLQEWHHRTNDSEILLPNCVAPNHSKGIHLAEIDRKALCPNHKNSVRYITKDNWKYRILAVSSTHRSISVSWKVDGAGSESWGLVYRRATDSPYQMILSTNHRAAKESSDGTKNTMFIDDITGLMPDTLYIVCVAITQNNTFLMEPSRCREIHTKVGPIRGAKGLKFTTIFQGFTPSQRSITVKWQSSSTKSLSDTKQFVWNLKFRRFATLDTTQVMVKVPNNAKHNQSHEYEIKGLEPFSGYAICFQSEGVLLEGDEARAIPAHPIRIADPQEGSVLCKEVVTLAEENFPVTEIAVATAVSTSTTVFVAVVMFFCCPRSFFRCQATKWRKKLLKKSEKSSVGEETKASNNLIEDHKPEDPPLEKISNLPNGRYLGPRLGSQKKITPAAIPEVPPIAAISPPPVPPAPPAPPMPTVTKANSSQSSKMSTRQLPPIPRIPTTALISPVPAQPPPSSAHSTTPLPSLPSESIPSDPVADYSSSDSSISSVVPVEGESPENNEDEGYLTPKRPRKIRRVTSANRGYNNEGSIISKGEGYIHPDDIHYLGGRKVQVFIRGSRTLPRKVFLQNSIKEVSAFHPRYSLPHAWRRKGKEIEEPPIEQIPNASLWFKPTSIEEFPSLKSNKRKKKEIKRTGKKDTSNNPYCIEHV